MSDREKLIAELRKAANGTLHPWVNALLTRAADALSAVAPSQADEEPWDDRPDEWSDAIKAAHPTRSGSHETYATALRMVGNRHSKGALVALVNWLLVRGPR